MNNQIFQDKFRRLQDDYVNRLAQTYERMEEFALNRHMVKSAELREIAHIAHKLSGSGTTFGFSHISEASKSLLSAIGRLAVPELPVTDNAEFACFLEAIKSASNRQCDIPDMPTLQKPNSGHAIKLIYLLEDDNELAGLLATELQECNYHVVVFDNTGEINKAVKLERPDALIVDVVLPENEHAGLDWVLALKSEHAPPIPTIFLSQRTDLPTRLRAVRSGADFYLQKPTNLEQLKYTLHECIFKLPEQPYRLLIVEDDVLLAEALSLECGNNGFTIQIVDHPLDALEAIVEFKPEIILLDVYLPYCTGIELGQVIRQTLEHAATPLVFMSVEQDLSKQCEAIRLAGDDFIVKPFSPWQLSMNLRARVSRARMVKLYHEQLAGAELVAVE